QTLSRGSFYFVALYFHTLTAALSISCILCSGKICQGVTSQCYKSCYRTKRQRNCKMFKVFIFYPNNNVTNGYGSCNQKKVIGNLRVISHELKNSTERS